MTVLVMRTNKRFAVRQPARLRSESKRGVTGLLIELSLDGCRIGNVDDAKFALGKLATLLVDGFEALEGHVRWSKDGCVGLRFQRPLHAAALQAMIDVCRDGSARKPRRGKAPVLRVVGGIDRQTAA